jgi:hypothetical protein
MRNSLLLLAGLTVAAAAAAQTVYRYVYPDGRVVYSDAPVPGARLQGTVAPPAPATSPPAGTAARSDMQSAPQRAADKAGEDRTAKFAAADEEVRAATGALENAKARLASGQEPLPGERTGTAGGASRLNEEYWARQQELQKAVDAAQSRLDRAVAQRNALR